MRAVLSLLVLVSWHRSRVRRRCSPVEPQAPAPPTVALPGRGSALLQLSPMYVEISDTLAVADKREKQLLAELAVATDDATAEAIVRELESLPLGRILSILRIQARYARQENRPDLERQIKMRMLELQGAGRI
ncbi:MAG: hypothetical protein IPI48_08320 [bacterium]|nr:hypothetical protein [bacterium]